MAITTALCTSFKLSLLNGEMDFSSDTTQVFKIALYTSSATINADTTAYSTTNETSGTGYDAGGKTLTLSTNPTQSASSVHIEFSNVTWTSASFTARGALIYKSGGSNTAIAALDFGEDKQVSSGNFVVQLGTVGAGKPILSLV